MKQRSEHDCEPRQLRLAWIVALACIAMTGLTPAEALAEDEEPAAEAATAEEAAEATEAEDASEEAATESDGVVSEEELAAAQKSIDEAQAQLDEARRQMEMRIPYDKVEPPEPGPGLVAVVGRA